MQLPEQKWLGTDTKIIDKAQVIRFIVFRIKVEKNFISSPFKLTRKLYFSIIESKYAKNVLFLIFSI